MKQNVWGIHDGCPLHLYHHPYHDVPWHPQHQIHHHQIHPVMNRRLALIPILIKGESIQMGDRSQNETHILIIIYIILLILSFLLFNKYYNHELRIYCSSEKSNKNKYSGNIKCGIILPLLSFSQLRQRQPSQPEE